MFFVACAWERLPVTASGTEQQASEYVPLPSSLRHVSIAPRPCLVAVPPTSSLRKIIVLVKKAGAHSVALLVPNGTKALQTVSGVTQLHHAAKCAGVQLTLYAADQAIVQAARQAGVALIEAQGPIAPPRAWWKRFLSSPENITRPQPADVPSVAQGTVTERVR